MKQQLIKKVPNNKIHVIPNFVDVDKLNKLSKKNDFSKKYNIDSKFVISYAGNMGPAQGLDNFINAATSK